MEIRKVQMTGGSSYIVTIPKEWARSHDLKKNDPLGMMVQPDGTLLVTIKTTEKQIQRTKTFQMNNVKGPPQLMRLLIGAYIAGFDEIHLKDHRPLTPRARRTAREYTHLTIGQEIVEETPNSITIKDLLNPAEMPMDKSIRRSHIIVQSMHEDAIRALIKGKLTLAKEVIERDTEVDRLHWLIARQLNLILRNVYLTEKMGVNIATAINYFQISRIIERIGDHAVRISNHSPNIIRRKLSPKTLEKIGAASHRSLEIFNRGFNTFISQDLIGANENIMAVDDLEDRCNEINTIALRYKGALSLSISSVAGSIRRVGEYAVNISEIVINHLVSDEAMN